MDDQDPDMRPLVNKSRYGNGAEIKEKDPQDQLRPGKRQEIKREKIPGMKKFFLGQIKPLVHLGDCPPEREHKQKGKTNDRNLYGSDDPD